MRGFILVKRLIAPRQNAKMPSLSFTAEQSPFLAGCTQVLLPDQLNGSL